MKKSFAEVLRAHRLQAGLTQTELCNLVNKALRPGPDNLLTQATLSAWESKRQSPSAAKRVQLQEIARILKMELALLDDAVDGDLSAKHDMPDDAYVLDVRDWVRTAGVDGSGQHEPPRIWFIAPQQLPAFSDRSAAIADLWQHNLELGVGYRLFWVLEDIKSADVFDRLSSYLHELAARFQDKPLGTVKIYLIRGQEVPQSSTHRLCERSYNRAMERARGSHGKLQPEWYNLGTFGDDPLDQDMKREISIWSGPLHSRLAVYVPAERSAEPAQASLLLTDTRPTLRGPTQRAYRWLSPTDVQALCALTTNVEEWLIPKIEGLQQASAESKRAGRR